MTPMPMSKPEEREFVIFHSPGTFFDELSAKSVASRDAAIARAEAAEAREAALRAPMPRCDACEKSATQQCFCPRCEREPTAEEKFWTCDSHRDAVNDKHRKVRGSAAHANWSYVAKPLLPSPPAEQPRETWLVPDSVIQLQSKITAISNEIQVLTALSDAAEPILRPLIDDRIKKLDRRVHGALSHLTGSDYDEPR